jgi:hypothetical protein
MTVLLVAAGCAALAAATAGAVYLFFGHYWHVLLTRKADDD